MRPIINLVGLLNTNIMATYTMDETAKYYRGETIGFYVGEDLNIDLDSMPFKVNFSTKSKPDIDFDKSQLTRVSANLYYGEIPNTITKDMATQEYSIEVFVGDNYTSIAKDTAFCIADSRTKKYAL